MIYYNFNFFSSEFPYWKDHRANVSKVLHFAYTDDQLDLFLHVLDFLVKKYPETDPQILGKILASACENRMEEYVVPLLNAGVKGHHIQGAEAKEDVIDFMGLLLKEKAENEG